MEEIDLREFWSIIKKKEWIIALTIILLIAASAFISFFVLETEYYTFTTLIINDKYNEDFTDIVTNDRLIKTLREIANSRLIINKSMYNLGLDPTLLDVSKKINISVIENTGIIKIEVYDKEPKLASEMANEIANVFIEYVKNNYQTLQVKVINKAEVPIVPRKPNIKLNLAIGGLLGFLMGILLAFFLEYFEDTIKTSNDLQKKIGLSVIGKIPKFVNNTDESATFRIDEAYKMLRTNIISMIKNNIQSVLVTSSVPTEGKSTVIANLAIAMAQNNQKVLIIDCNLREPCIHNFFDIPNKIGLTNKLIDNSISTDNLIQSSKIDNLDLMTSGRIPLSPSEILGSNEMKVLLEEVKGYYDLVLIDSAAVLIAADSAVLSTITDCTILVCASGETKIDKMKDTKEILDKLSTNILGVVLNKVH